MISQILLQWNLSSPTTSETSAVQPQVKPQQSNHKAYLSSPTTTLETSSQLLLLSIKE